MTTSRRHHDAQHRHGAARRNAPGCRQADARDGRRLAAGARRPGARRHGHRPRHQRSAASPTAWSPQESQRRRRDDAGRRAAAASTTRSRTSWTRWATPRCGACRSSTPTTKSSASLPSATSPRDNRRTPTKLCARSRRPLVESSQPPNALQRYLGERLIGPAAQHVLRHPWAFLWQSIKGFRANQGLLLAGAVAYYALLSIVPLLILTVIALSHWIDQGELLATLAPLPRVAGAGAVARDRRRARQLPRQARGRRLAAAGDDDLLQLARVHRARERDVGDLPAPRRRAEAPLHLLGADPVRLHPLARHRPPARHAGGRQPPGGRQGERRAVRRRVVAEAASPASCSICSESPARSSC